MEILLTFTDNIVNPESLIVEKKISEGELEVFRVYSSPRQTRYALKLFPRDEFGTAQYQKEKLMFGLKHPNIIQHISTACSDHTPYVILTEYAKYGDFFDLVSQDFFENETLIRTYFQQLVEGVEYLHSQGVAHLDLKLENLMMGSKFTLKIIDFDQAQKTTDSSMTSGGTAGYRAPELINGTCKNLTAIDVYCLGVILFTFKTKDFPFGEYNDPEFKDPSCYSTFVRNNKRFWRKRAELKGHPEFFREDFIELLNGMLHPNPEKRLKIKDIKNSKWYQGPTIDRKRLRIQMRARWEDIMRQKILINL